MTNIIDENNKSTPFTLGNYVTYDYDSSNSLNKLYYSIEKYTVEKYIKDNLYEKEVIENILKTASSLTQEYFGQIKPFLSVYNDPELATKDLLITIHTGIDNIDILFDKELKYLSQLSKLEPNYTNFITIMID